MPTNFALAEEFANPQISKIYQPTGGTSNLSGQGVSDNPLDQLARALSGGGGTSTGMGGDYGQPISPISPISPSPISPIPGTPYDPTQPSPLTSSTGGDSGDYGMFTDPYAQYGEYGDWYQAQDIMNMGPWQQALIGAVPFGGLLTAASKYSLGINPFANIVNGVSNFFGSDYYTPEFMDSYVGPGTAVGNVFGISPSEQRDMLIQQELDFWSSPQEEAGFYSDATATAYGTDIGSEQTQMLAEQDMGFNDYGASDTGSDFDGDSDFGGFDDSGYGSYDVGDDSVGVEDSGGGDSGGGDSGGGSYIATAATQALGEKGLKVFEDWRDYMFTVLPTFTASFGRYRATAPKIVSEINKKENSKNIYSWIWDMHLKPIYDLIVEDKDSEKALKDYKMMVRELSTKFLSKGEKK